MLTLLRHRNRAEWRYDVVSPEQLDRLKTAPLPRGFGRLVGPQREAPFRDLYLDTQDDFLQRRGINCRLRVGGAAGPVLRVEFGGDKPRPGDVRDFVEARALYPDARAVAENNSPPVRRLAGLVDPAKLEVRLELRVDRITRTVGGRWRPYAAMHYDNVTATVAAGSGTFQQLAITALRGGARAQRLAEAIHIHHGLRPVVGDIDERARLVLKWAQTDGGTRAKRAGIVVLLLRADNGSSVGLLKDGPTRLPLTSGGGVVTARALLQPWTAGALSDVQRIGTVSPGAPLPTVEVWSAEIDAQRSADVEGAEPLHWMSLSAALAAAATENGGDPVATAALALAAQRSQSGEQSGAAAQTLAAATEWPAVPSSLLFASAERPSAPGDPQFLNGEVGLLAFTGRVLAMAENERTPLKERFRFLSIVAANLDEFFMVRVAGLRRAAAEMPEERSDDGLTPEQQLALLTFHIRKLVERQYRCYHRCLAAATKHGTQLLAWSALTAEQRERLREYFREEILLSLTPFAMTLSPGHPLPRTTHLSLSLAVTVRDTAGGAPHFAEAELSPLLPRYIGVPDAVPGSVILLEDLARANLDLVYPGRVVEQAYAFRVTRGAELALDDFRAGGLLEAVAEASKRRFEQPVVRVEVERAMPAVLRELVARELQRDLGAAADLAPDDIYAVDGPLDLRAFGDLPLSEDPSLCFPPFSGQRPFAEDADIWSLIDTSDQLLHHPFDDFDSSVVRIFAEAARDPAVRAIKVTLYRVGARSPIIDALVEAAHHGKEVVAFVELKARFDEEHNVEWAKRLETAGGRVVHGLRGLKNHAKLALFVRRAGNEGDRADGRLRSYVHIGTGNYNAANARRYTDLSLLTTDESVAADAHDLFNAISGTSEPPRALAHGSLLAPHQMLPAILELIEREAAHARAGRSARIRIKVNGLSDPDVVRALYRASQDGVDVRLVVRGVCTLRPGVPGISERITVVSVLGRFLEHSRMYHFANGGADEYLLGSADLRPRNLRRRVELLVPVRSATCRAQLDRLLTAYLDDPAAWVLSSTGEYLQRVAGVLPTTQDLLAADAALSRS